MASVTALHPSHAPSIGSVPPDQQSISSLPKTSPTTDRVKRGPVTAILSFYDPPKDGSAPFNYVEKPPEGQPQNNFGAFDSDTSIHDVRGRESSFGLEKQAFATLQGYPHNPEIDWEDDDNIKQTYYPEVERILLDNVPGSNRVLLFDHTIRRADPNASRGPVNRAHIDQTTKSATERVRYHLPDEAEELLKHRFRLINVWRPLNGPVESHPLAFADSSTVHDDDMVPIAHIYPNRTGETASIRQNDAMQWYYWSGTQNDERILLQCFDSGRPNNRVPHTAFTDPRTAENATPRESIEVRALVFG
ncbi:MAG: hypothetical protein M1831_003805 [Alyxoria varia]|nr:MAG: hypothetical protein M1831_003805 [Alyxoria varia]